MVQVSIKISGDVETINKLKKMGTSLRNFEAAMKEIGKDSKQYFVTDVFASQGGAIGEKWDPLSKKYKLVKATGHSTLDKSKWRKLKTKSKIYPGRGILVASGKMQKSFDYDTDKNSVTIGNTSEYFKYHQSSGSRSTKLPRRQMMKVNSTVKEIIRTRIDNDIRNKIQKAGF